MRSPLLQLLFEPLVLSLALVDLELKTLSLRFKFVRLTLKFRYLAFQRGVLVCRQRKTFAKNVC